jgi:UDP-GlcNAc:undecaprenyl-phosphate GlcNAc-1-phosphate transferase
MHALPTAVALVLAAVLARPMLRLLVDAGSVRPNFRGRVLPVPFGLLMPVAALLAVGPLLVAQRVAKVEILYRASVGVIVLALGAALVGLADDALGAGGPRGLRGHAEELKRGRLTTGALKALVLPGLALLGAALVPRIDSTGEWLLAAAVLAASVHVFNLLDVRPGRAFKALALLGAALAAGSSDSRPLFTVGLFAGPALVAGIYDLRERAMLGDTGAAVLGALAGMWIVLTLSTSGQAVALILLLAIALYGELRSISELLDRTPGLRQLDSWGRPS